MSYFTKREELKLSLIYAVLLRCQRFLNVCIEKTSHGTGNLLYALDFICYD